MFSIFLKKGKSLLILLQFPFRGNKSIILRLFRFEMICVIAMNIFSISWERVILLLPRSRKYFINAFYLHLVEKCNNLYYFCKIKNNREIVKNVFLSTKWSNVNDSLWVFLYTKVFHFHEVEINTKTDRKLENVFFYKSRNYCDNFISTKWKGI